MDKETLIGKRVGIFTFTQLIGRGNFGSVYEATDERTKKIVAIKVMEKEKLRQNPKLEQLFKTEITVLKKCKNENVVGFVNSFKAGAEYICLAMEYCNGGDLSNYIAKKRRLIEDEATDFLKQILNGFKGLHEHDAMHRDLKSENILLHNNECKIADLGFSKLMNNEKVTNTRLGTALTMAPEILWDQPYGRKADIWSIGVVYYHMLFGDYPFKGYREKDILRKIKNTKPDFKSVNISEEAKDFIQRCLTVEPGDRIGWEEIYEHPLLCQKKKPTIFQTIHSKNQINISSNINFYRGQLKKEVIINPMEHGEGMKIEEETPRYQMEEKGELNMNDILEEVNNIKKKQQDFQIFQREYLTVRNNCMFIYKFICPYISYLPSGCADSSIYLFMMSKKAFLDIMKLRNEIQKKINVFNFKRNFDHFVNSEQYKGLLEQIRADEELIRLQAVSYCEAIHLCSQKIGQEFDLHVVYADNFNQTIWDLVEEYWFLLAELLTKIQLKDKEKLLRLLEALQYYAHKEDVDSQAFDLHMGNVDFAKMEESILTHLKSTIDY